MKQSKKLSTHILLSAMFLAAALSREGQSAPAHWAAQGESTIGPGDWNVLLIVLDDLGNELLDMYVRDPGPPLTCGADAPPAAAQEPLAWTPALDRLRAEGVMFTRAYAHPTCSPSRASILTGRNPCRFLIGAPLQHHELHGLRDTEILLPEVLRDLSTLGPSGYARGAFGKWHVSPFPGDECDPYSYDCHPVENGFQRYVGSLGNMEDHYRWRQVAATENQSGGQCSESVVTCIGPRPGSQPSLEQWDAHVTAEAAKSWIEQQASPFLACVAFHPPHEPWQTPPLKTLSRNMQSRLEFLGYDTGHSARKDRLRDRRLLFRAAIEAVDTQIGNLLETVQAHHPNTMVLVVGDNGTYRDFIVDPRVSSHGKRTLYELGIRVPLIVSGPLTAAHAGETCRALVSTVDIWRTVANLAGIDDSQIDSYMDGAQITIDSESFLSLILDPSGPGSREYSYSEQFENDQALPSLAAREFTITDGTYKLLQNHTYPAGVLFDLLDDPCEQFPLRFEQLSQEETTVWHHLHDMVGDLACP